MVPFHLASASEHALTKPPSPNLPGGDLEAALGADNLLVVDVSDGAAYREGHVPGAVFLDYAGLLGGVPPATGRIAEPADLSSLRDGLRWMNFGLRPYAVLPSFDLTRPRPAPSAV